MSLVPSITELVCDLGLSDQLVGRTGFCIHPWETVRQVPKVGGTKDVLIDRVRALEPTHVIVNVDENPREVAAEIATFASVIVTHPLTPDDNLGLYRQLGSEFGRVEQAERLCGELEAELERLRARAFGPQDVLYLIWRDPWMTVSPDTYISATLALIGWRTLPRPGMAAALTEACSGSSGERETDANGQRELDGLQRYPEVSLEDYAGRVDRVLLSSEPFHFKQQHLSEVRAHMPGAAVSLIDGEMTSWYGSRAIQGLRYLGALR